MAILVNVILPIFLVASAAALLYSRLHFDLATFSRATFYIFTPSLVFNSLASSAVGGAEFGRIAVALTLTTLVMWAVGEGLSRLLGLDGPTRSGFIIALLLINCGNYGLPVNLFAFGEPGLTRAALYVTVSATLNSSLGVFLAARGRASTGEAFLGVFRTPIVYAGALGLVVNLLQVQVPEVVLETTRLLGVASVPALLMVLGTRLRQVALERPAHVKPLPILLVGLGRLLLAPLVMTLFATLVGLEGLTWRVVVLETAMPTAVTALVLASEFDAAPDFVAAAVFANTMLSLLTVTLLVGWLA